MKLTIPYGRDEEQDLVIPDENFAGVIYPNDVTVGNESEEIRRALDNPAGGPTLEKFLRGGKDVVFIVNDGTRPTPTKKVLDALDERMDLALRQIGLAASDKGEHIACLEPLQMKNMTSYSGSTIRN